MSVRGAARFPVSGQGWRLKQHLGLVPLGSMERPERCDKGIFGFFAYFCHIVCFEPQILRICCRVQGVRLNFTFCSFLQMPLSASSSFLKPSVGSGSQY